ncbi:MAG: phytanoyl-CoA dioxygenase family protein [Methylococcales bacterium]
MLTKDLLQKSLSRNFWLELCPELSISDSLLSQSPEEPYDIAPHITEPCTTQYKEDGYFKSQPVIPEDVSKKLVDAIIKVTVLGFPAQFCLVFDDFWKPLRRLNKLLEPIIGKEYLLLPDFWFYNIATSDDDAGWSPHRDLQFPNSVNSDGTPKIINLWIPLTDATTLNGCMYMLPASRDPDYPKDFSSLTGHDFRSVKHYTPDMLQNFRALPAKAGSILGWNQYVFHWGSRSSHLAEQPRINYSMYVQRADVKPYDDLAINLNGNNDFDLTFEMRLGIVCRSLWQYKDTNDLTLSDDLIEFALKNHTLLNGRGYQKLDISRNDPCWCGSGNRFKHCHGVSTE